MNEYFTTVLSLLKGFLPVLALLTLIDFVLGVVVALVKKKFQWVYLYHFLETDVLPILVWIVVVMINAIPQAYIPKGFVIPLVSGFIYLTIFASIIGSILESIKDAGIGVEFFPKIGIGGANGPK